MKTSKLLIFLVFILGGLIGLGIALASAEMIHKTGDDKFCSSCHVMEPMRDSYLQDTHGGNNAMGVKAECVSCHLPHDSVWNYTYKKAMNGISEAWQVAFSDPENNDWEANRRNKKEFVYDSGCISCHENVKNATASNMKSFLPHRDYFNGISNKTCVECHENVGHKNLGFHLKEKFSKVENTK